MFRGDHRKLGSKQLHYAIQCIDVFAYPLFPFPRPTPLDNCIRELSPFAGGNEDTRCIMDLDPVVAVDEVGTVHHTRSPPKINAS